VLAPAHVGRLPESYRKGRTIAVPAQACHLIIAIEVAGANLARRLRGAVRRTRGRCGRALRRPVVPVVEAGGCALRRCLRIRVLLKIKRLLDSLIRLNEVEIGLE